MKILRKVRHIELIVGERFEAKTDCTYSNENYFPISTSSRGRALLGRRCVRY